MANINAEKLYHQTLASYMEPEEFKYDLQSDPSWSAYKKMYLREADRAAADTLAQVSAASGGRPSSYAVSAAQQASNYYTGQLSDMAPTLEQNAYSRYLDGLNKKATELQLLQKERQLQYDRAQAQKQREEQAKQQAYANALTLYQTMGYATPEVAAVLGIPSYSVTPGYDTEADPSPSEDEEAGESTGWSGMIGAAKNAVSSALSKLGLGGSSGNSSGNGSGSDLPTDTDSINALGYTDLTPEKLEALIASGEVIEYVEDGMYKYKLAKPFNIYDPLGTMGKGLDAGTKSAYDKAAASDQGETTEEKEYRNWMLGNLPYPSGGTAV